MICSQKHNFETLLSRLVFWSDHKKISKNTTFFIDLDESIRYHTIQISAWDSDAWEDDRIDISSDPDWSSHIFEFDSVTSLSEASFVADGTLDSTGWDGVLEYSLSPFDNREYRSHEFSWDYDGNWFSLDWNLDYSIYGLPLPVY